MLKKEVEIEVALVKPFLMGRDVKRYVKSKPRNVVIFPYLIENGKAILMEQKYIQKKYPLGWEYILKNKSKLEGREKGKMKGKRFYAYIYPKNLAEFDCSKIMTPYLALGPNFTYDSENLYHTTKVFSLAFKDDFNCNQLFILGLLNSKLMNFHIENQGTVFRGGYQTFNTQYIETFNIKRPNLKSSEGKHQHDEITKLVEKLLTLNQEKGQEKLRTKIEELESMIMYCESKINEIVYQLYELTKKEIKNLIL